MKTLKGVPESIDGIADHVHLLVGLRATQTLADVLRETKSVSSSWVHSEIGVRSFAWQEGYGAFTIGISQKSATIAYIKGQAEHHRKRNFEEEFLVFLSKHEIEYDPKYVWG